MDGLFVSFEGVDGCGKSTQVSLCADWLRERGHDPLLVREPGGTELGECVRELLLDPATDMSSAAEALLYAASRAELVDRVIEPALRAGRVVIADRFIHSSMAYQGAGRRLGMDQIRLANELAVRGTMPHQTILLGIDPGVAAERCRAAAGAPDRIERAGVEFFEAVADAYEQLAQADPERIVRIEASGSAAQVHEAVRAALEPQLVAGGLAMDAAR